MAGDVGLALAEELGELPDGQLLLGGEREEPEPDGLGEELVELPAALGRDGEVGLHAQLSMREYAWMQERIVPAAHGCPESTRMPSGRAAPGRVPVLN